MSTFGKKAFENWDYENEDARRYLNTNKDLQLKILEKWYPKGEVGYFKSCGTQITITDYREHLSFYSIEVTSMDGVKYFSPVNPLKIRLPSFERQIIIEKLLK